MFIRKKATKSGTYHYLVEARRENGTVKQKVLCYLGEFATVEAALEQLPAKIEECRRQSLAGRARMEAEPWFYRVTDYDWDDAPRIPRRTQFNNARWRFVRYRRLANEQQARLDTLRQLVERSAQNCLGAVNIVGTTAANEATGCSAQNVSDVTTKLGTTAEGASPGM